jgi:N-acetylglucosamine kinase-like BadF-type ATPase
LADTAAVLAIDGGNSKTDVALIDWDGTVLAALRGPGASHEAYGIDGAMQRLGELIHATAEQAGLDGGGVVARHGSACLKKRRCWPQPCSRAAGRSQRPR